MSTCPTCGFGLFNYSADKVTCKQGHVWAVSGGSDELVASGPETPWVGRPWNPPLVVRKLGRWARLKGRVRR